VQFFLASDLLDKNDKLLMHISDPEETARYGKLLARSKTKQNRYSVAAVSSTRAGASSERWCRGTFGPPVGPGPCRPTAFLGLCSPDHGI